MQSPDDKKPSTSTQFKKGVSGNIKGRPKKGEGSKDINDTDRKFYGTDSKKFLERALYRSTTWEDGLRYAKELRMLQHPSLQQVQTKQDNAHTITLRWSKPEELPSNEIKVLEATELPCRSKDEKETT